MCTKSLAILNLSNFCPLRPDPWCQVSHSHMLPLSRLRSHDDKGPPFSKGLPSFASSFDQFSQMFQIALNHTLLNASNTAATFVQRQGCKDFYKPSKPCHVCIHSTAFREHSQMSTNMPGFHKILGFLRHFILAELATSSIRVKRARKDEVFFTTLCQCRNRFGLGKDFYNACPKQWYLCR